MVKIKLYLTFVFDKELVIPVDYQKVLQGFIYNLLPKELGDFYHDEGFKSGARSYKMFSFSRLIGESRYNSNDKTLTFPEYATLIISSIIPEFLQEIANSCMMHERLSLNGQSVFLEVAEFTQETIINNSIIIETLSPITAYTTYERRDGSKFTHYFQPQDEAFRHIIEDGVFRKYEAFTNEKVPVTEKFKITPIQFHYKNKVVTKYKQTYITAWRGKFRLEATDPKYLNFALATGLGSKTSQGFGCVELCERMEKN